jgi:hypothetical protein
MELTRPARFIEDLQRRVANLEREDESSSSHSYAEQDRDRPDDGIAPLIFLDMHLTITDGENAPVAEAGLSPSLEDDTDLTNPLSTGPSAFMAAATGRTCESFSF